MKSQETMTGLYQGNLTWVPERTIYLTVHGSHAYGTSTPTSDMDYRGVLVPPRDCLLGMKRFEQAEQKGDPDLVIFSLVKFITLASTNNPNVLEILYTDPSDHVVVTGLGRQLLAARHLFLSKRVRHTFSGYAMSQLHRMETHRKWLLNPPKAPPTRAEYNLPERTVIPKDQLSAAESLMKKQVEAWQLDVEPLDEASKIQLQEKLVSLLTEMKLATETDQMLAAGRVLGFSDNFLELLDKERGYNAKKKEWDQYQDWKKTRNAARSELEAKYGYDTKHAMHLVRLMTMAEEMLADGVVHVKRPDAERLRSVRAGAWTVEQLLEFAHTKDAALNALYETSKLPHHPDTDAINALCVSLQEQALLDPSVFEPVEM